MGTIRNEELSDMGHVMSTMEGRRFIWRLLGVCGLYQSVALTCPKDLPPGDRLLYNAGRQDIAQGLHTEIFEADSSGKQYLAMMSEAAFRKLKARIDQQKPKEKTNGDDDGGSSGGSDAPSDHERGGG